MKILISFGLLLMAAAALLTATPASRHINLPNSPNFFLAQAPNNSDLDNSTECFNIYKPLLDEVAVQWSANYNICEINANKDRVALHLNFTTIRTGINNAAKAVVDFIENCTNITNDVKFFNCYANLATNALGTIYEISFNSTDDGLLLAHRQNDIDLTMYQCTNDTERTYIESTVQIYDALDYCLQNGPPEN